MADYYGSVALADAYHTSRGNGAWAGLSAAKLSALIRASAYVDGLAQKTFKSGRIGTLFPGTKTGGRAQVLAWPRSGATDIDGTEIDDDSVPVEVLNATYEAALREVVEAGSLSPDYVPSSQIKREKVDVLETEYFQADPRPVVVIVRELLGPVMSGGAGDITGIAVV
jgi:hypothetical protein